MKNVKVSLLALHFPNNHTEAITCVPQIFTYVVVEKGMEIEQRRTKVSFGKAMIQELECCSWQKGMSQDEAMLIELGYA